MEKTGKSKSASLEVALAVAGGLLASVCCVGPLLLVVLGAGGAWLAQLRVLEPLRPGLSLLALAVLGYAHYRYWRTRRASCNCGSRAETVWLWLGTLVVLAAVASPYVLPYFILPH